MSAEQHHPITPPPELVREWHYEHGAIVDGSMYVDEYIATQASRWGFRQCIKADAAWLEDKLQKARDQELEACCDQLERWGFPCAENLHNTRRSKSLSLKEQALKQLECVDGILRNQGMIKTDTIRSALESLPD